ncbi:hypothetical protein RNJ44_03155 [Nakaseomyces bracarensis]|uniref:DUF4050 domain-containing protein n=1 Tax=Nakaseomyces bracarensis TaxID=273131 RepID=A0ABR4NYV5_9SACH
MGITTTLKKWKSALKKATHETLNSLDDVTANEEKVEALFDGKPTNVARVNRRRLKEEEEDALVEDVTNELKSSSVAPFDGVSAQQVGMQSYFKSKSMDRVSSGSRSITGPNDTSVLGMKLSEESEGGSAISNLGLAKTQSMNSSREEKMTYLNFDTLKECEKLRQKTNDPFMGGPELWKTRRKLWCEQTVSDCVVEASNEKRKEVFDNIPEAYYTRVYKKLVVDDKPLKEPINLSDALHVINAGWIDNKKWANASHGLP